MVNRGSLPRFVVDREQRQSNRAWHAACTLRLVHFTAATSRPVASPNWKLGAFRLIAEARGAEEKLGGDFYALELRDDKRLAVFIGDVCGHGREGAKLLADILPGVDDLVHAATRPSVFLAELNRRISRKIPADRFVTGAAFELDARLGLLTVANAGHVPAVLRSARGQVSLIGWASGPPLGMVPDASYVDQTYVIGDSDVIVFMTDGILEALENDFSKLSNLTLQAAEGIGEVHRSVLRGVGDQALEHAVDDMTLLSLQVRSQPNPSRPTIY